MRSRLLFSSLFAAMSLMSVTSAVASELTVSVEVPALDVAEYHKPYIALWIENEKGESTNLAVWYQLEERGQKSDKGEEWLKDMRQWWRRIGRETDMPVDGVSGATRAPGKNLVTFIEGKAPLGKLKKGNYVLMVEAAREVGGRELVKVPFVWPAASEQSAKGKKELGEISVSVKP
ncbi:MAG TPA: DUF2271 domain-containing protein [Cellvibrio sp.]|nr:DUF2271 domain-containing protein [Cellvibrio sp.]